MVRTASGAEAPTRHEGPGKRNKHASSFGPSSTAGPAHREAATGNLLAVYYEGQDYYNGRPFKGNAVELFVTYDSNLAEIRAATRSNLRLSGKINPDIMVVFLHIPGKAIGPMADGISIKDTITRFVGDFDEVLGKCYLHLTPPQSAAAADNNDPLARLYPKTFPKKEGVKASGGAGGGSASKSTARANKTGMPTGGFSNNESRRNRTRRNKGNRASRRRRH